MTKADAGALEGMNERLEIVVRLLALSITSDLASLKDKAILLNRAGLSPMQIAGLLGTTANTVSVALSAAKRSTKRRTRSASKE